MFVVRDVKACCPDSCVRCRPISCSGHNSCNSVVDTALYSQHGVLWPSECQMMEVSVEHWWNDN